MDNSDRKSTKTDAKKIFEFLGLVEKLKHVKRTGWLLKNINECESIAGHMYYMAIMTFLLNDYDDDDDDNDNDTVKTVVNGTGGETGVATGSTNGGKRKKLDRFRCMELALVHDIGEAIIGDITPYCGISKSDKHAMETKAVEKMSAMMGPRNTTYVADLFQEYNSARTAEAKFVKQLDKFDLIFQAFQYEKRDSDETKTTRIDEFFDAVAGQFKHPLLVELYEHLLAERGNFFRQ